MWKSVVYLLLFFTMTTLVQPQPPCPDVFQYVYNGSHWNGIVTIKNVPNKTIKLDVHLSVATILPSKYSGEIKIVDSKETVYYSLRNGGDLHYKVYFPVSYPVPLVTLVSVNGEPICVGPAATGSFVTTISLEHELYIKTQILSTNPADVGNFKFHQPNGLRTFTTEPSQSTIDSNKFNLFPSKQFIPAPTDEPSINSNSNRNILHNSCGVTTLTKPLIVNGSPSQRGLYPWLAAVFVQTDLGISFMCGGNLVSRKHVLTAAHCILLSSKGKSKRPEDFLVMLGKYKIKKFNELGSKIVDVQQIDIHPENRIDTADADLAIITLVDTVQFSTYIRPICMASTPQSLVDTIGMIAGWGRDELGNRMTSMVRDTSVVVISQEKCLRSHIAFRDITSDRTFCAGGREEGNGPCTGDSGGGLYIQSNGKWYLHGIISRSIVQEGNQLGCDTHNYSVFVDITKFTDWINSIIN